MALFRRRGASGFANRRTPTDHTQVVAQQLPPEARVHYERAVADLQRSAGPTPADRFADAVRRSATLPCPPGTRRGVAAWVGGRQAVEPRHSPEHHVVGDSSDYRQVVMAIHIAGEEPYEVRYRRFSLKKMDMSGSGYPVLVDLDDPERVEFLWDEVPDPVQAVGERLSSAMSDALAGMESGAGTAWMDQGVADMVAGIADPEQRAQLAQQMRDAGFDVPDS